MPVGELLARTSSHELTEWQAYEREYGPLGAERGDLLTASLAHTMASLQAGPKARRLRLSDFVLQWRTPRRRTQTPSEMLDVFRALAARQKGPPRVDNR